MDKILNSSLFIPSIILLGAAVISIIILVVVSKKNKNKSHNAMNVNLKLDNNSVDNSTSEIEQKIVEEAIIPTVPMVEKKESVVPVTPMKSDILPTVPMKDTTVVPSVPVVEESTPVIKVEPVVKKEVPMGPPPTIDIPVPSIDDSPITIDEVKSIVGEDLQDSIQVEKFNEVKEEVNENEIINVTEAKQLVEDNQDTITVEEVKSLVNDVGESVHVEETKQMTNDIGETAFKSIPNGDTGINTNIKVDPIEENINKTEIFSLDDIKSELAKFEENKREL